MQHHGEPPEQPAYQTRVSGAPPVPSQPLPSPYPPVTPHPTLPAYPGMPPFPPAAVAPPRRRRWALWLCLGLVAVLVACVLPVGVAWWASSKLISAGDGGRPAGDRAGGSPAATATAGPSAASTAMRGKITKSVAAQATALLSGDRKGFVATADPGVPAAVADLTRRFRTLRALRVTRWATTVDVPKGPTGARQWSVTLRVRYCIVVTGCRVDPVAMGSTWVDRGGRALLTKLVPSTDDDSGPLPWEVSDLRVAVGKRTVVATTGRYASRLPELLADSERAARAVDPFVIVRPPPDRYRVYLAGPAEWKRWFGGGQPEWSVGRAVPVPGGGYEVVLNAEETGSSDVGALLRHELTHVATLRGVDGLDDWWLVEGIAEYVQMSGRPLSHYDGLEDTRKWVNSDWDGDIEVDPPRPATPEWQVAARYGVAFLAVRCIADRFGEDKMIEYFAAVARSGQSTATAAKGVLDEEFPQLLHTCGAYVRNAV